MWDKPWQNMRKSLANELYISYPINKAAYWMGHGPDTALKYYARIAKDQSAAQLMKGPKALQKALHSEVL